MNSRAWLACSATYVALPLAFSARTSAGVMRAGSTSGTRVWKRTTFTWAIAPSRRTSALRRRGDRIKGSPPVTITSQISGRLGDVGEGGRELRRRRARRAPSARPSRGGSRSGNRPRRRGAASAARGPDSGARCPRRDCAPRRRSGRRFRPAGARARAASGMNWRAIGSSGSAGSISSAIAGVMATA